MLIVQLTAGTMEPMTINAFPGHAGRCWPLARGRSFARIVDKVDERPC